MRRQLGWKLHRSDPTLSRINQKAKELYMSSTQKLFQAKPFFALLSGQNEAHKKVLSSAKAHGSSSGEGDFSKANKHTMAK
jgi:hypothetical protein